MPTTDTVVVRWANVAIPPYIVQLRPSSALFEESSLVNQTFCAEAFVALATCQVNDAAQFYEALFDQPPQTFVADRYAEFVLPGLKLALFQPQKQHAEEFAHSAGAAMSLCLEVTDLEGAIAHLTQLGYPPPGAIQTASHGREIYAYDPDGNRLILHQG